MLRLSKVLVRSIPISLTLLGLTLAGGITRLQANPVCTSTITLAGGSGTVLDSMLTAGVCVQSQDKLYGSFNFGSLPMPGSVTFGFVTAGGIDRHSITFTDSFMPGNTYTDSYEVEVLEGGGFPTNNMITQLSADITQTAGGPTTLVETTTPAPASGSINFSKTANSVTGPFVAMFSNAQNVVDLVVTETLTTGPESDASAILNTFIESQQVTTAFEPATLELLGVALIGLSAFSLRRKSTQ